MSKNLGRFCKYTDKLEGDEHRWKVKTFVNSDLKSYFILQVATTLQNPRPGLVCKNAGKLDKSDMI